MLLNLLNLILQMALKKSRRIQFFFALILELLTLINVTSEDTMSGLNQTVQEFLLENSSKKCVV